MGIAQSACVLVACWVKCTRAHGADGCSCNSTAGDADRVCEPVERLRVLAVLGPGIAHSAWCAGCTPSQGTRLGIGWRQVPGRSA